MRRPILMSFPDIEFYDGQDQMTPKHIAALLNLTLIATNNSVPAVKEICSNCVSALSFERDIQCALPIIRNMIKIASHSPELSEAIEQIIRIFEMNEQSFDF